MNSQPLNKKKCVYSVHCVFQAGSGKSFLCKCSFIEIYNEQIFDLLDSASAGLFLREHIKKGVFVDGAVEQVLSSAAEAYQVFLLFLFGLFVVMPIW